MSGRGGLLACCLAAAMRAPPAPSSSSRRAAVSAGGAWSPLRSRERYPALYPDMRASARTPMPLAVISRARLSLKALIAWADRGRGVAWVLPVSVFPRGGQHLQVTPRIRLAAE